MTPRERGPRPGEAGFVLIGVVIFVLALTIIGISLFSLSSYEAQFLQRSIDGEQAFQSAVGGIERAKFALTRTSLLQSVSVEANLPEGVDSTVAVQDGMSAGEVIWQPTNIVTIRVTAGVNGTRRTVEGRFSPIETQSYYSQLITVSAGIEVKAMSPPGWPPFDRDHTVLLDGPVWESSGQDTSLWLDRLQPPAPVGIRTWPADSVRVPVPDVASFFAPSGPIATASLALHSAPPPADTIYTLDASGATGPAYFRAEDTDPNFSFNSFPHRSCTIQVRGLAVWLLPRGAMFYQGTVITGNPSTDCLVVIAKPMTGNFGQSPADGPTSSICFLGSLQADIPVVLVSSGEVLLWHENDWDVSTSTNDLAIFARSAEFMGPEWNPSDPHFLQLHRYRNGTGPLNTYFLDALAGQGALPNASSGGKRLDLIPGTWHASDR